MGDPEPRIYLNTYFRHQQTTGQQRFAQAIAAELADLEPSLSEIGPSKGARTLRGWAWAELQVKANHRPRTSVLVSLTSRAPAAANNHVVTIHDLFPITHPEWYSRAYVRLHRPLLKHHLNHAAGIVAVSEPVAEQVRKVARRGMPVTLGFNAPLAGPIPAQCPFPDGVLPSSFMLTVGSLEPRKNLPRLLTAFEQLPAETRAAYPLLVAGGTNQIFAQNDMTASSQYVHFLGRITDTQLRWLYGHAAVLISASLDEGFGLPLIEAAKDFTGVIVASDIAVYRWLMEGTSVHFFNPESSQSISRTLACAVEDATTTHSYQDLFTRFSWHDSAESVLALARELGART